MTDLYNFCVLFLYEQIFYYKVALAANRAKCGKNRTRCL